MKQKNKGETLNIPVWITHNDYKKDYFCVHLCVSVYECVFEYAEPLGWRNSRFNPAV